MLFYPSKTSVGGYEVVLRDRVGEELTLSLSSPWAGARNDSNNKDGRPAVVYKRAWSTVIPWHFMAPGLFWKFVLRMVHLVGYGPQTSSLGHQWSWLRRIYNLECSCLLKMSKLTNGVGRSRIFLQASHQLLSDGTCSQVHCRAVSTHTLSKGSTSSMVRYTLSTAHSRNPVSTLVICGNGLLSVWCLLASTSRMSAFPLVSVVLRNNLAHIVRLRSIQPLECTWSKTRTVMPSPSLYAMA